MIPTELDLITKRFAGLPTEFAQELSQEMRARHHKAKEFVFHEGDEATNGYILLSGRVAMLKFSPNGKELIAELIYPGDPFGIVSFVNDKPYPLSARAQVDTTCAAISRAAGKRLVEKYPAFQQMLFAVLRDRMESAHNLARAIAHDRVETRLANVLTALIPDSQNGGVRIEISRQELADLTAMTLETASRVTKAFEREGILDASELGVVKIIDVNRLQQFTAG